MAKVRARLTVAVATCCAAVGCADLIGIEPVPIPAEGAASDGAAGGDASDAGLPGFDASGCDACAAIVPPGWTPVLLATDAGACPAGYPNAQGLETNPTFQTGACTCSPENVVSPTCLAGTMSMILGCNGSTVNVVVDGGCNDFGAVTLQSSDLVYTIDASGGSCTAKPQADDGKLATTSLSTCTTNACPTEICDGNPPPGFAACIEQLGDASCPAPFVNKQTAAAGYSVDCTNACGTCSVSAQCTNAAVTLYGSCGQGAVTAIVADGQCHPGQPPAAVGGVVYNALTTNVSATAVPTQAPTAVGNSARTICCR